MPARSTSAASSGLVRSLSGADSDFDDAASGNGEPNRSDEEDDDEEQSFEHSGQQMTSQPAPAQPMAQQSIEPARPLPLPPLPCQPPPAALPALERPLPEYCAWSAGCPADPPAPRLGLTALPMPAYGYGYGTDPSYYQTQTAVARHAVYGHRGAILPVRQLAEPLRPPLRRHSSPHLRQETVVGQQMRTRGHSAEHERPRGAVPATDASTRSVVTQTAQSHPVTAKQAPTHPADRATPVATQPAARRDPATSRPAAQDNSRYPVGSMVTQLISHSQHAGEHSAALTHKPRTESHEHQQQHRQPSLPEQLRLPPAPGQHAQSRTPSPGRLGQPKSQAGTQAQSQRPTEQLHRLQNAGQPQTELHHKRSVHDSEHSTAHTATDGHAPREKDQQARLHRTETERRMHQPETPSHGHQQPLKPAHDRHNAQGRPAAEHGFDAPVTSKQDRRA